MAQFKGTIESGRGSISRLGNKQTGLNVTCDGWTLGCTANIQFNEETGRDELQIFVTHGSKRDGTFKKLGKFYITKAGNIQKIIGSGKP